VINKSIILVLSLCMVGILVGVVSAATTMNTTLTVNFTLEQEQPSAPAITGLTNSTPTYDSVVITWQTNQTNSNNRVKYSTNPDLSNASWSSWANNTNDVRIELIGLEQGTTYYYQAWSYNALDSNYNTSEPSSAPYRSFTTQTIPHGLALANAINANDTVGVHASYADNVVTITADEAGEAGNNITTTETIANASFASGTLTGGGTASTPWSKFQDYGVGLWTSVGGLIVLVVIVTVLGLVLAGVINLGSGTTETGESTSIIPVLIGVSIAISALVIIFSIVPYIGYSTENVIPMTRDTYASNTLTFTGPATDGETVTISNGVQTDVYEFDTDNSITPGNIRVPIS